MISRQLRLVYPPSLLDQPILAELIRNSRLNVNIRQAHITLEEGWLEIELTGTPDDIKQAMSWLQHQGIVVQITAANKE